MASTMPVVTLDTTIAEFYKKELQETGETAVLLPIYPTGVHSYLCDHRNDDGVHDNKSRYVYQTNRQDMEEYELAPEVRENISLARTVGQVLGQLKFVMTAGNMPVACFDVKAVESLAYLMKANVEILRSSQRPDIHAIKAPSDIRINTFGDAKKTTFNLIARLPADGLHFPQRTRPLTLFLDSDIHYELLTKRALMFAPFSTPSSYCIDLLSPTHVQDPIGTRTYIPGGLNRNGIPLRLISDFIQNVIGAVSKDRLPFVFKVQQTTDGQGTWIIKTEKDRLEFMRVIPPLLRYSISQTTWENAHLHCSSIVISNYVPNSGVSYAVTFFIQRNGNIKFICCAEQTIGNNNSWDGACIQYRVQEFLYGKFHNVIRDVADYLFSRGYFGFVGIDVIEDLLRRFWVIDLNVRPPGSLILGFLKGFMGYRGFDLARLISHMKVKVYKEEFLRIYASRIAEGRIIVYAWFDIPYTREHWASFIVAGENKEALDDVVKALEAAQVARGNQQQDVKVGEEYGRGRHRNRGASDDS